MRAVASRGAELVQAAHGSLVVQPENGGALARSIAQLADTPGFASALGRNGRRFVTGRYDRDMLSRQMLDVLTEACHR